MCLIRVIRASGQPAWVRIPRGIVLPWLLDGQLWQLKVRTNRQDPKYLAISGGHPCLFGADTLVAGEPAILAEGEFDTLLLWQEADDLVEVATLGSCNRGLSARALRYLLGCPRLLVAYDVDTEGEKRAERLGQLSPRMQRIRPPVGKDVTAFWQAGGRVREWVRFELARLDGTTSVGERLARHQQPEASAPALSCAAAGGAARPRNDGLRCGAS
jgi:Toprim-like